MHFTSLTSAHALGCAIPCCHRLVIPSSARRGGVTDPGLFFSFDHPALKKFRSFHKRTNTPSTHPSLACRSPTVCRPLSQAQRTRIYELTDAPVATATCTPRLTKCYARQVMSHSSLKRPFLALSGHEDSRKYAQSTRDEASP